MIYKKFFLLLFGFSLIVSLFLYLRPSFDFLSLEIIPYMLLSSFLYLFSLIFRAMSFSSLVSMYDLKTKRDAFLISIYSMLLNEVYFKGSGDVMKAKLLSNKKVSFKKSALLSLIDRLYAFFSLIVLMVSSLNVYIGLVIGFLLSIIFSFFFKIERASSFKIFLLSLVGWFFEVLSLFVLMHVLFGYNNLIKLGFLVGSYTIIGYLTFIPLSMGIKEGVFVFLSRFYDLSYDAMFVSSLIFRVSTLIGISFSILLIKIRNLKSFINLHKAF